MSSSGLPSSDRSTSGLPALLRIIIAPSAVASDRLGSEPACKLALTPYFEPQSGYAVSIWRVILCRPMLIFSVLSAQLDPTQLDMLFHVGVSDILALLPGLTWLSCNPARFWEKMSSLGPSRYAHLWHGSYPISSPTTFGHIFFVWISLFRSIIHQVGITTFSTKRLSVLR